MTRPQTTDLASWLTAVWDEEERLATGCIADVGSHRAGDPFPDGSGEADYDAFPSYPWGSNGWELAYMAGPAHPTSVLARIAADRKILARCMHIWSEHEEGGPLNGLVRAVDAGLIVHDLAEPYRDRPGFRSEWLVERQGVEQ